MAFLLGGISFEQESFSSGQLIMGGVSFEQEAFPIFFKLKGVSFEQEAVDTGAVFVLKGISFEDLVCFDSALLSVTNDPTSSQIYCNTRDICLPLEEGSLDGHVIFKDILIKAGGFQGTLDPSWQADCDQTYNFTKCAADSEFTRPTQLGDILHFQFQFDDPLNVIQPGGLSYGWNDGVAPSYLMDGTIEDFCSGASVPIRDHWVKRYVGIRAVAQPDGSINYEPVQGVQVDTSLIPYTCFQIKVQKFNDLSQVTFEEACSEPYKIMNCERTFSISSDYKGIDCQGQDYSAPAEVFTGTGGEGFGHSNFIRVPGSMELQSFGYTRTTIQNNRREISSQKCDQYLARTFQVPEYFVRILSNILNGPDINVNGLVVQFEGPLDKDNEIGTMWLPEMNFSRCQEMKDFDCD